MIKIKENYYLRPVRLNDAPALFEFSKDENVVKYLTWEAHQTIDDTIFAIEQIYFKNTPISYAIVNSEDIAIGIIDFNILDSKRSRYPEIGYFLNPKYHNLGIMTNAVNKMLEIGFNELGYEFISISHIIGNIASEKVILKTGFKYIKNIDNIVVKNNKETLKYYEMKGSDFNEKAKRNI